MKVFVISGGKKSIFEGEASCIADVLRALKINQETVIVRKGRAVVPPEDDIREGEEIELIKIFSGG